MGNVKKNFIYNITYQILVLIIPIITVPYISRIIGSNGIGIYSYTYSIAYYFMIFAMLGLNNYGNRTIAKVRDDKALLSKTFKEIYLLQIITSSIMIISYYIYLLLFNNKYDNIAIIQSLYVISCMFDINWFFFGMEKFKLTVTRNLIIKIISLILIFLFINEKNDIWIYTLILSGSTLLSQLLLFPFLKKYIDNTKIKILDLKKHLIPCLKLFLPVIAVTIYKVMDKTMIGIFSDISEVGYYENAEKIINIPNAIIAALGTVMLPRMSNIYSKGEEKESKRIIEKSIKLIMFLAFAMTFGLVSISNEFSILFYGDEFKKSGELIQLLSFTIIFLSWGNVIRTQYLIPKERDKEYIISAFLGAGANFLLNIALIPKYGAVGACYGTIVAELVVMLYQSYAIRKELPLLEYLSKIIPFLIKAIIMFLIIYLLKYLEINSIIRVLLQICIGILIYFILNIKYIFDLIDINKFLKRKKA